ncbi:hypothetical protein Tco_0857033 [Tanacetum coccineum]|uniref:Uncharacterized protein n=1 Tax=Tanacetum coccineum TaxID=301880 RepID=A0ABQ5B921_9ASTR
MRQTMFPNTDLDGRDVVMPNVILPQVQATQDVEDTHVTLTREAIANYDVFEAPASRSLKQVSMDEQAEEEEVHIFPAHPHDWFQQLHDLPSLIMHGISQIDKFALWGNLHWGKKRKSSLCIADLKGISSVMSIQKDEIIDVTKSVWRSYFGALKAFEETQTSQKALDTYRSISEKTRRLYTILRSKEDSLREQRQEEQIDTHCRIHKFSDGT